MISRNELVELLDYNFETGAFTWKKSVKGTKGIGKEAGTITKMGYVDVTIRGKKYGLHRLAFLYNTGTIPLCVDHVNGIKSDNRWCNLRPASYRENGFNYGGTGSVTGFKNVYIDKRYPHKFFAQIRLDGRSIRLGTYNSVEEAFNAAKDGRIKYCGEFVNHGPNPTALPR